MNLHPGVVLAVLFGLGLVTVVGWAIAARRTSVRLAAERAEFARQVGAIEYGRSTGTGTGTDMPSFGYFPNPHHARRPFSYAMEFTRGTTRVLAAEWPAGGVNDNRHHEGVVQVVGPLPADAPYLMVGNYLGSGFDPETREPTPVVTDLPTSGGKLKDLRALTHDAEFAHRIVTPELAALLHRHKRGSHLPRVTFVRGVLSTDSPNRLRPRGLTERADLLIEIARLVDRQQRQADQ
ncbi:hypothetical protein BJF85_23055 [Saccharomonospora sp. CUA-673]|uniref:hypothetical protein n=1 Tax=Saccharomonospora sp. CUA-673 TaxID=1904969 RepID=UPI000961D7E7|nr:hypothetical protein [Saccharomonospora sp. CUA-673]OLT42415.1 hypothetical protein BJF85_23055 [Saccharomonospora sp. CUA-673]